MKCVISGIERRSLNANSPGNVLFHKYLSNFRESRYTLRCLVPSPDQVRFVYVIRSGMLHFTRILCEISYYLYSSAYCPPLGETCGAFVARERSMRCKVSRRRHYITPGISDAAHIYGVSDNSRFASASSRLISRVI